MRPWKPLLLWLLLQAACAVDIVVEYATNGDVKLNIMNITFHTTELHVKLLGCDRGYYDQSRLVPPTPSWQTEVTPFNCLECRCSNFEFERAERFYVL